MSDKPIRVLQVVTQMTRGGLETMLMNYDRHIDHSKVQFDFLEHRETVTEYDREILDMGGIIHRLPRLNPASPSYMKALDQFFAEHPEYRIVHSHLNCMAGIPLKYAKKHGIPVRIAHSHNSSQVKDLKYPVKLMCRRNIPNYATQFFACGEEAGRWMFGEHPFSILNNAIDAEAFTFQAEKRNLLRSEFGIQETDFVIGHVGRFNPQKNHMFLLEIFCEVLKTNHNCFLMLIGDGELKEAIEKKAREAGIADRVIFAGTRGDVNALMQAMDVFVFPSLFEGLALVSVEAQAAGLPCIFSDRVPKECEKTQGLVTFVPLEASVERWAEQISRSANIARRDTSAEIKANGYDIRENALKLQQFYLEHWQS